MKNLNGNKFTENDPLAQEAEFGSDPLKPEAQGRLQQTARKMSHAAADTWEQTKEKATVARQRTELLLRENPVPTVLGALALNELTAFGRSRDSAVARSRTSTVP